MAVRFSKDGKQVFVANYLLNAVQVVGLKEKKVLRSIAPWAGPRSHR